MKTNKKIIFGEDSVINGKTDLERFIPPNPGWNYVRISNHPEDCFVQGLCGKWLLFTPKNHYVETFRKLSKLMIENKLTHCFKASGSEENGFHVFCIYCGNYQNIKFVKKIAKVLLDEGLINNFGYLYKNGVKAIYFKTDNATHYKSRSKGQSLTLFKFEDTGSFFVKRFEGSKPLWESVNSLDPNITENFEDHLDSLEMEDLEENEDF